MSGIVLHYAREAPLEKLTAQVKRAITDETLSKLVDRLTKDVNALKTEIQNMDTHTAQLLQLEADVNRLCLEDDDWMKNKKEEDDNPRYVVNTITGRCRMILIRTGLPTFWKTRCTWLYGLAYHEDSQTPVV